MVVESPLALGLLGRPHGVRGEISFRPYNEHSDLLLDLALPLVVLLAGRGESREIWIEKIRVATDKWLLTLRGVNSREAAALLTQFEVSIARDLLPPLQDDEFYLEDLVGCTVVDQDGIPRGVLQGMFFNGAHQVVSVVSEGPKAHGRDDEGEILLPLVPEYIVDMDLSARRLSLFFPDGEESTGEPAPKPHARPRRTKKRQGGKNGPKKDRGDGAVKGPIP